jgi:hypothetical protein
VYSPGAKWLLSLAFHHDRIQTELHPIRIDVKLHGQAQNIPSPFSEEENMPQTITAPKVFEREFLGVRARLLELGAALDRIGRASGFTSGDPRSEKIRQAIEILLGGAANKTEQIQLLFSLPYEEHWQ